MTRQQIILDTSPLITLCSFRAEGQLVVEHLLATSSFSIAESVAAEATVNPGYSDAAVIKTLLDTSRIALITTPSTRLDNVIDSYMRLGVGERDTIRLGLSLPDGLIVLDDYLAFVIAARFGLQPVLLLDLIVSFVEDGRLDKALAQEIVEQIARRYSLPFINHTRHKLK